MTGDYRGKLLVEGEPTRKSDRKTAQRQLQERHFKDKEGLQNGHWGPTCREEPALLLFPFVVPACYKQLYLL